MLVNAIFSDKEQVVFECMLRQKSIEQTANILHRSTKTVEYYRHKVLKMLNCKNSQELILKYSNF